MVGIVSSQGILPSLSQGIFDQRPGEFGLSIDLETTSVCVVYGDSSIGTLPIRTIGTSLKKRENNTIRRSTRLARQIIQSEDQRSNNRNEIELTNSTEPFQCQFRPATMTHPIRIAVDRVQNRVLAFTPTSNVHFEIKIPQLSQIEGPIVPIVSFSSGAFRGYFSNSHPAFSSMEEFIQDYLGLVEVVEQPSRHERIKDQNLVLFNRSLLKLNCYAEVPSIQTIDEPSKKGKIRKNNRISISSDVIGQSLIRAGSKTIVKYQKAPSHLCPGAPRRLRRITGPLLTTTSPIQPQTPPSTPPSTTPGSPRYSTFQVNRHQEFYSSPPTIMTKMVETGAPLAQAFHIATKARRSNESLGLSLRRPKKVRIVKNNIRGMRRLPSTMHSTSSVVGTSTIGTPIIGTAGGMNEISSSEFLVSKDLKHRRKQTWKKGEDDEGDWNPKRRHSMRKCNSIKKTKKQLMSPVVMMPEGATEKLASAAHPRDCSSAEPLFSTDHTSDCSDTKQCQQQNKKTNGIVYRRKVRVK